MPLPRSHPLFLVLSLAFLPNFFGLCSARPLSYCEILANVVSETKTPFKFKIELPKDQQTEELVYEGPGSKNIILKGYDCMADYWKLSTFTRDAEGQWKLESQSIVKLNGAGGQMTVKVNESLQPRIGERYMVSCGESAICGGGPIQRG